MTADQYPYTVKVNNVGTSAIFIMIEWCRAYIGTGGFDSHYLDQSDRVWVCEMTNNYFDIEFRFCHESHAILFQLKWSNVRCQ